MFMAVMMMVHAFGQRIARQPAKMAVIRAPASVLINHFATANISTSALVTGDGVAKHMKMNVLNSYKCLDWRIYSPSWSLRARSRDAAQTRSAPQTPRAEGVAAYARRPERSST